ncbi:MAG: ABC-type transport auxiliary lipoprotein family protein, partial [Pollutimonas bauzanensis]
GPPRAGSQPWSLRIATPYSSQVIDSVRVLVLPQPSQVSAYGGARWSDPAPVLLRDYLAGAFRAEGGLASVSSDAGDAQADFELGGDLIAFQVEYQDGAPLVHIRYDAALLQVAANRIVATRSFDIRQPVQGKEVPQVIAAFGAAADSLSAEMRPWVLQHGARPAKAKTRR